MKQDLSRKKTPERTCLGCRKTKNKSELVRVVRSPDGKVLLDRTGRMNGRGAYLCRSGECVERALSSGALARALKAEIPPGTAAALRNEILSRTSGAPGAELPSGETETPEKKILPEDSGRRKGESRRDR